MPRRGTDVRTVEVDGEAVLLDEGRGHLHLLNATGALVWACLDGASSIGDIVSDISDELSVPYEQALDDTLTLTRELGEGGLLANVTPSSGIEDEAPHPSGEVEAADPRFVLAPPDH